MQTCYVDPETRTIADLLHPGELIRHWTISRINVPVEHRGKGHGTKILKRIIADANAEHLTLALEVSPSDGLDYDQLYAWYKRHGFRRNFQTGYMVRQPR